MTTRPTTRGGDARRGVLEPGVRPSGTGRPAAPCGTRAAYQQHRRRDETPCDACHDAHRRYFLYYRARFAQTRPGRIVLHNPTAATLDWAIAAYPDAVIVALFDQETP